MNYFDMNDDERLALKNDLSVYLGEKPSEEELASKLKELREKRKEVSQRIVEVMTSKEIPLCVSQDYGYQVSVVKKTRTAPVTLKQVWVVLEELCGADVKRRVEEEAKKRYCVKRETQSLKLTKVAENAPKRPVLGDGPAPKRAKKVEQPKQEPSGSVNEEPSLQAPRYDEDNDDPESEEEEF